jgi:hydroxymethylpyrimidine pyrophosphatase-like HAD family hydrolase
MIKILLGIDPNKLSRSDKKILNFFLKEISKGIKNIFIADVEIRKKANIYEKYQPYFMTVFICIALGGLIFTNRYFIKNREYYNQSSRLLEKYKRERYNHMYNNKHHQYWAKMKEMENKRKEEEMKNANNDEKNKDDKYKNNNDNDNKKSEISGDKDKCTKEELEYIKKLADEHKGDFILSK